mgnify:CR=1 FL=1
MKYLLTDTAVTAITEPSGVIQNLSFTRIEISNSSSFTDSLILFPLQKFSFDEPLYMRAVSSVFLPVQVNVVPFTVDGSASASTFVDEEAVASDDDANDYFDSIFGGDTNG